MKRSKLEHEIDGPFEIMEVSNATNTVVIQRKNETERVSMHYVVVFGQTRLLQVQNPKTFLVW